MNELLQGVEGIVFELDSVLFDKSDWVLPATEYAAQQMRIDPQRAVQIATDYIAKNGGADPQIYNSILLGCGQFDTAMNIRAFTSLVNQFQPPSRSIALYPGVEEALGGLRLNYRLCIVTDGPPDTQRRKVMALGLNELVGTVFYSDEIDGIKSRLPDPRPLLRAASQLRLRPDEMMFVGHNPVKHFQRTREIGFLTVRVLSGEYGRVDYPSDDHRADFDIPSVASLPGILPRAASVREAVQDGWGVESTSLLPQPQDAPVAYSAEELPSNMAFEDAAFAALFQMTSVVQTQPEASTDAVAGHSQAAAEVPQAAVEASDQDYVLQEGAERIEDRSELAEDVAAASAEQVLQNEEPDVQLQETTAAWQESEVFPDTVPSVPQAAESAPALNLAAELPSIESNHVSQESDSAALEAELPAVEPFRSEPVQVEAAKPEEPVNLDEPAEDEPAATTETKKKSDKADESCVLDFSTL